MTNPDTDAAEQHRRDSLAALDALGAALDSEQHRRDSLAARGGTLEDRVNRYVGDRTDFYFTNTRRMVQAGGDVLVTAGIFMRRPVMVAIDQMIDRLRLLVPEAVVVDRLPEGSLVGSETKLCTLRYPMAKGVEIETLLLQRVGVACVAAYNVHQMCVDLPETDFIVMDARHLTGDDHTRATAYGASVGSRIAKLRGARGFVGTSQTLTAPLFGLPNGLGTTPHAAIGYVHSRLIQRKLDAAFDVRNAPGRYPDLVENFGQREISETERAHYLKTGPGKAMLNGYADLAAETATLDTMVAFMDACPEQKTVVILVDYFGREITDALMCADYFYQTAQADAEGKIFGVRLDTHGGRFAEGLDYDKSVEIMERWLHVRGDWNIVEKVLGAEVYALAGNDTREKVRKILLGAGVSAANIINMRQKLNAEGFKSALIVGSSGFDPFKCKIMAKAAVPLDVVGTGSFGPETMSESYATLDYFDYGGVPTIKIGREWLANGIKKG